MRILAQDRNPYGAGHGSSDAFFGGGDGDDVADSLTEAGWDYVWIEASYHYAMRAPDGSIITYVEGDIYKGNTRARNNADIPSGTIPNKEKTEEVSEQLRGLRVEILRGRYVSSNGGVGDDRDVWEGYIVGDGIPPVYPVRDNSPVFVLGETTPGYKVARPIAPCPENRNGYMASGAYVKHSGCWEEWHQVFGHSLPIPLHDRTEG